MKFELSQVELGACEREMLPLCFHIIYTRKVYFRDVKESMELASSRYGAIEVFSRGSDKLISKILIR